MINSRKYPMEAFSEEARANQRYLVFATQAEKEGYPQIAALFRATARAEKFHAQAHLGVLWRIRSTADRLWESISGEGPEIGKIFPAMLVADQEKTPASPYQKALARLAELAKGDYYVCSKCGFTCEQTRPEKCSHCQSETLTLVKVG